MGDGSGHVNPEQRARADIDARVLADRRWFVIDADAWDAFDRQLNEPVPYENDLRDLLRTPTVFDQQ